ncbi:DUF6177 family protein [Streptomyces sp. DSM 116494]|uniref:DUF6177 family protein n=1 Tax=Streptomyces okerensis TaxID=3344655 RepID=UPI00388F759F
MSAQKYDSQLLESVSVRRRRLRDALVFGAQRQRRAVDERLGKVRTGHRAHPRPPVEVRPVVLGPASAPALHYPLGDGSDAGALVVLRHLGAHLRAGVPEAGPEV